RSCAIQSSSSERPTGHSNKLRPVTGDLVLCELVPQLLAGLPADELNHHAARQQDIPIGGPIAVAPAGIKNADQQDVELRAPACRRLGRDRPHLLDEAIHLIEMTVPKVFQAPALPP